MLTALLLAILFACFTLEKKTQDRGFSSEAWMNPWLAAGRLLEMRGMNVRFAPEYASLPPHARVIVLATPLDILDSKEQQTLLAWVKQGGHLVTEMQSISNEDNANPDESDDLLTRVLDVRLYEHEEKKEAGKPLQAQKPDDGLHTVIVTDEGSLQTGFDRDYFLQAGQRPPEWKVSDEIGAHVLRFPLGKGHVTLLSDSAWMDNRQLARGDHGALLWRVVSTTGNAESSRNDTTNTAASAAQKRNNEVWLIHGQERPSLLRLMWEAGAALMIVVAVFVLAWLWQSTQRFGPPRPLPAQDRRRLSEHLEASGRYLLRQQALAGLFDASRQRLMAEVQTHYPQWRRLPPERLAQHLGERAGIESGAILRLLNTEVSDNLLQFAADIRLINRLRKAL
jgi:catechol 2,3-dioxygenase-like lactoylglutathione lyase family enzyme